MNTLALATANDHVGVNAVALGVLIALFTVGNLAGQHPVERWGAGGITAMLTILCAWIGATG
jgi:hypothetical protein